MPKAQKSSQDASGLKNRQITDFFSQKPAVSEGGATRLGVDKKKTKQVAAKENATPHVCSAHSKASLGNETSTNGSSSSVCSRAAAVSPVPTKVTHITSPMQPSTKRLRSQSITASRSVKQVKRTKNILCESQLEEDKMEVDENSIVYVPAMVAVSAPAPSFLKVPSSNNESASGPRVSISPDPQSEVSLVPSSVSDEVELDSRRLKRKDAGAMKGAVVYWRQQALPPSPLTYVNSPVEPRRQLRSDIRSSTAFETDWNMDNDSASSTTPSRPSTNTTTNTSFPTPPSTDGPNHLFSMSPVKVLDSKTKTEQLIQDIKTRARANARTQPQTSSSPLLDIPSLDSSDEDDDEDDGLAVLGLKDTTKLSPIKAKSPVKLTRYNLRKPAPEAKVDFSERETSPSPPVTVRRKPTINPLDALLGEKRASERKDCKTSVDREARLRALADLNLDDESDEDSDLKISSTNGPTSGADDVNPFVDDEQKRQVMGIFTSDKAIEEEEEVLHRRGMVGVALWNPAEPCTVDTYDDAMLPLDYQGSDPTLQILAETISYGNRELLHLILQSGALELASYSDAQSAIDYLITLALSSRDDGLDLSAFRLLPHILCNNTTTTPIVLSKHVQSTLCALGAEFSVLEKVGWTVENKLPRYVTDRVRSEITERLVFCIADVARSGRLRLKEIPELVAALLLIGVESSVSHEMRIQVSAAIHEVCQAIGETDKVETDLECAISNVILRLVQPYSIQNKLYSLSLFSDAGGRTARIARLVAHAMLTDKYALLSSQYSALPSLEELLVMLSTSTPGTLHPTGKFEIHDKTDYIDMGCWTSILAVAITGMARYVEIEEPAKTSSSLSRTPSKDKDESIFEIIQRQLWKIHNRIQDTRAAHLDRSQTKAILAHTAFRILYQYQSIVQYRKAKRTSFQSYFCRK